MLRDIVAGVLRAQPDMEVIEAEPGAVSLLQLADLSRPDVVITGFDDPGLARGLLTASPHLRVMAVTGDDGDAWLYELRPYRVHLGEVSPRTLVEQVRRRTAAPARWSN
jgi:DNA-binding NarL/FixJ family response regulator